MSPVSPSSSTIQSLPVQSTSTSTSHTISVKSSCCIFILSLLYLHSSMISAILSSNLTWYAPYFHPIPCHTSDMLCCRTHSIHSSLHIHPSTGLQLGKEVNFPGFPHTLRLLSPYTSLKFLFPSSHSFTKSFSHVSFILFPFILLFAVLCSLLYLPLPFGV